VIVTRASPCAPPRLPRFWPVDGPTSACSPTIRTGSVKSRARSIACDAEGALDGFRATSTIRWRGLGSALLPKPDSCHVLTFSPVLVVLVLALVGAGGARRAATPQARVARLQSRPQRRAAPGNNCHPTPLTVSRYSSPAIPCNSASPATAPVGSRCAEGAPANPARLLRR
jgi:hypothetical protein